MEHDSKFDEMDPDEITSPLLSMVDTPMDSSNETHQFSLSSSKKMIKPTKSINDLLNFESDSDLGEQQTVTPPVEKEGEESFNYHPNYKMMHQELEKELNRSDNLMSKEETTIENLSIEEIGHIRFSIIFLENLRKFLIPPPFQASSCEGRH